MTPTKKTTLKETAAVGVPDATIKANATDAAKSKKGDGTPTGRPGEETATPPVVKRPLGAKEIIPFEWKLLARSGGLVLTLFKAIEREDVEAQLERVRREGYYTNLRIVGADEKVKQAKSAKAVAALVQPDTKEPKPAKRSRKSGAKARVPAPTIMIPKLPDAVGTKGKGKSKVKTKPKTKTKAKAKGKAAPKAKAKVTSKAKVASKTKTTNKSRSTAKKKTSAKTTARTARVKKKAKTAGIAGKTAKRRSRRR